MYPDPNEALTAYGQPQQPAISDQALLDLSQVGPPPGPDPQAALAAYGGQPMPDTSMQALNQQGNAMADQQAANNLRAEAQAAASQREAEAHDRAAVDAAMTAEEIAMAREEHKGEVDELTAEGDKVGDNRSGMSKWMGTIAVALGGMQDQNNLVAGLKQGLNVQTDNAGQIANAINTRIERDISLQREKLAGKRDAESSGYRENLQAIQLAHAAKIEEAQSALQGIAAQAKNEDSKAAVMGANAQLEEQKQGMFRGVLQQREAEKARAQAAAARANVPKALDFKSMDPRVIQSMIDTGMPVPTDVREKHKAYVDGQKPKTASAGELSGYESTQPLSAGDQSVARQIDSATRSLESDYDALAALRKKNNGATWKADDINEAQRIMRSMPAKFSQTFGAGAPSKTEMEMFEESLVDPTSVHIRINPEEVYKRGKESIRANATSKLDSYGYKPKGGLPSNVQGNLDALRSKRKFVPIGGQ